MEIYLGYEITTGKHLNINSKNKKTLWILMKFYLLTIMITPHFPLYFNVIIHYLDVYHISIHFCKTGFQHTCFVLYHGFIKRAVTIAQYYIDLSLFYLGLNLHTKHYTSISIIQLLFCIVHYIMIFIDKNEMVKNMTPWITAHVQSIQNLVQIISLFILFRANLIQYY